MKLEACAAPSPHRLLKTLTRVLLGSLLVLFTSCREAPPPPETPSSGNPDLAAQAKDFVVLLAAGDFETAAQSFDKTMLRTMPPAKLQEVWGTLLNQAGDFQRCGESRVTRDRGYDLAIVTCEFGQNAIDVRVVFNTQAQISGLWFAPAYQRPAYADPNVWTEQSVTVGEGEWTLPATLTLPKTPGLPPGLVLVHGSGPHDRDETIGPNKPFRDLAHGLATRGIAVLRYEKRTFAHQKKLVETQGIQTVNEETIDDAVAAFERMRGLSGIDPQRVFVLGHSLGGMLIPRIAARTPEAAGFIILAGTARPLEDVIIEQLDYVASLNPPAMSISTQQLAQLRTQAQRVRAEDLSLSTPSAELPFSTPASYWLDLRGYRPTLAAQEVPQRLLILQGGRDYQVTKADYALWSTALDGKTNASFRFFPELNHLFAPGQGKARPEEYQLPLHVSPEVIQTLADWLRTGDLAADPA